MWEISQICVKWLKYVANDLDMLETASVYGKWLRYVGNGSSMWEIT